MITFIALIVFFTCLLEIGEANHFVKEVSQRQTENTIHGREKYVILNRKI